MFCRNCGKETAPENVYCMNCGARPLSGSAHCPACGAPTTPISEICVKCGTRLILPAAASTTVSSHRKSKVASILLAVFLSYWTWLYTYKRDGWKFWTGIGFNLVIVIAIFIGLGVTLTDVESSDFIFEDVFAGFMAAYVIALMISSGINIWAIVDTAIKRNEWYDQYPDFR